MRWQGFLTHNTDSEILWRNYTIDIIITPFLLNLLTCNSVSVIEKPPLPFLPQHTHLLFRVIKSFTRWFKYDRDWLCVNKSQFVPVIFEPPCISRTTFYISTHFVAFLFYFYQLIMQNMLKELFYCCTCYVLITTELSLLMVSCLIDILCISKLPSLHKKNVIRPDSTSPLSYNLLMGKCSRAWTRKEVTVDL